MGDGIRLDSLIGSYATSYTSEFDGASHRALGFIGHNGLLDQVGPGFDKHFTEMLKSEMFRNLELGGNTMTPLSGGGITGDGGTAATGGASGSDTAVFTGNSADYTFALVQVATANQGEISAWKVTDDVAGRDGTDVLVGIERARFSNGDFNLAAVASSNATPVITSNGGAAAAAITVAENTSAVTTVTATDANVADTLTYSIDGGADAALFTINAAGVLSLNAAPNFEAPTDAGANRVYDVLVKVSDGAAHDFQAIAVTVQNVDEAATGSVSITGYSSPLGTVATLSAANTLADPDGMSNFSKYQWQRFDGSSWVNIPGTAGNGATLATTVANTTNATLRLASAYTDVFGNKTFVSDETVYMGNAVANTIVASAGRDFVLGLGGNDTLTGGVGDDTVDGGAGNDTLLATVGDGNDAYNGGLGIDTYNLSATAAAADVNLTTGLASSLETGSDTLVGIENVVGSSGANLLTDAVGANSLSGNAGDDTFVLLGDDARDVVIGGVGNDTVDYALATADLTVNLSTATAVVTGTGTTAALSDTVNTIENFIAGAGNDTITGSALGNRLVGGAGNDILSGLAGADSLDGGAGSDTLTGGAGADILTGGSEADVFEFNVYTESGNGAAMRDLITDFLSGSDILDFAGIDANTVAATDQAFTFNAVDGAAFTAAGQLIFHYEGSGSSEITVIEGNINAALGTDFQVALVGHHALAATDFVL
ncbi:MAG: hypothetical protein GZ093_02955 [Rhodoferax sp.]|uniref:M10 family metallopeptidase C-terminal domain-containing protein n=1 Tax=Rhodoferax sp. TaxID=50421 RepID=UPI0014015415|nr:M10 family metallopeptidase C-terminal domain-containing protein [Rhodoferax sp.]NDP37697.1 hypothetical protein [Rhodoferax sp.]